MKLQGDNGSFVEISIMGRCHPHSDDYWDANWLEASIKINVTGFQTSYVTNLRVDELQNFYKALVRLANLTTKEAEFTTMEEGLYLLCSVGSRGQVACSEKAKYQQTTLEFELQTDLSAVNNWISDLAEVLERYPLIGGPNVSSK